MTVDMATAWLTPTPDTAGTRDTMSSCAPIGTIICRTTSTHEPCTAFRTAGSPWPTLAGLVAVLPAVMDVAEMHGTDSQTRCYRLATRALEHRYQPGSGQA